MSEVHITVDTCGFEVSAADVLNAIASHDASPTFKELLSPEFNSWTLARIPALPHLSQFFINGQKQEYGLDYVIDSALLNWLGYPLKTHWRIEIYYG